jgi:lipopolysaccharide export system permease protein
LILNKYYNKDVVNTFTSITLFIISIISANLLIRLFQKAYSQGLGIDAIVKFVILTLPENVTLVAPISLFLAIIVCFGKYFSNNEMFVTLAGGFTWMEMVKNTLKPTFLLAGVVFFTLMFLIPLAKQTSDIFQTSLSARALLSSITDNKIINIPNGRTLYINSKSSNKLNDVFLYQHAVRDTDYKVITAPSATVESDKNAAFINFKNVNIYSKENNSSKSAYGTADRAIYTIYDNSIRDYNHARMDRKYIGQLITESWEGQKAYTAELFTRLNSCISVIVAGLLAIAMCQLRPRQNKYAKLLPAVVVLAIYLCSNMFTNSLMASGTIPTWVGIWLPHIFFVIFAIRTIRKQNGSSIKV